MKNLGQISWMLAILLTSAAVFGLIVWRFVLPESEPVAPPVSTQPASPQPVVTTAQASAVQNSAAVAPVVAPVTEPVAAPVAESAKEPAEDLHDHDEQMEPPSQATIDAIREMKKPTPDEGKMTENPDGSVKVDLGNRFKSVPIATIGKDGKVHVDYHGEKYLQEQQKQEAPTP